jgi:Flp pilus assembly pilin Flp
MAAQPGVKPKPLGISGVNPCGGETDMYLIVKFVEDESGSPAVEYAILMGFIAVIVATGVSSLGAVVKRLFEVNF